MREKTTDACGVASHLSLRAFVVIVVIVLVIANFCLNSPSSFGEGM